MVRGNVCGLGSTFATRRIECKSVDPKQFPRAIIYQHPGADILPCPQITGRDVAVGLWRISQPDLENFLILSLYWSGEALELPKKMQ